MTRSKFSEEQIAYALKQNDLGNTVAAILAAPIRQDMQQRNPLALVERQHAIIGHFVSLFVGLVFILLVIGFAAFALGKWFRIYSMATILIFVVAGSLAVMDALRLEANLPAPWMGFWDRVNISTYMLWITVPSISLLRVTGEWRGRAT
jgi:hypothetical protein